LALAVAMVKVIITATAVAPMVIASLARYIWDLVGAVVTGVPIPMAADETQSKGVTTQVEAVA